MMHANNNNDYAVGFLVASRIFDLLLTIMPIKFVKLHAKIIIVPQQIVPYSEIDTKRCKRDYES